MDLNRIFHVNINVTDLDRSIAFYEKLGFQVRSKFTVEGDTIEQTCRAFGMEPNSNLRAAFLKLGDDPKAACIDLVQWMNPPTEGAPYAKANNAGMVRLCFHVDNPDEIIDELAECGIDLLGPVGRAMSPAGGVCTFFAFRDPDGNMLEVLSGVENLA